MNHEPVSVLLPCRAGSKRVVGKNTRQFAGQEGGLILRKLTQLAAAELVDTIIVSTDDPQVKEISTAFSTTCLKRMEIIDRPPELAIDDTLDAFLEYVPSIMPDGVTAWTHVTSPFFDAASMDRAIQTYRENVENGPYDSLMTVNEIRSFLWSETGCISHNRDEVRWPRSQDLPVFYEANSALFLMPRDEMLATKDRIGKAPYLMPTGFVESFDIDWPEDFEIAEILANSVGK